MTKLLEGIDGKKFENNLPSASDALNGILTPPESPPESPPPMDAPHAGSGSTSPSIPPTPAEERENGIHFTPRRAMTSFENLVAMANHQERLKEAKRMLWRDRGQPVVELDTVEACLTHALSGGFRSATLAFNIRACVNIILALIRIKNVPKNLRFSMIKHAILGQDTWRFAAMFGSFTSLYKFLINVLPILIPAINPRPTLSGRVSSSAVEDSDEESGLLADLQRLEKLEALGVQARQEVPLNKRKARLSLSTHAQQVLVRKQTRRWHAALAGAVAGGLAILWEKRGRRGVIAQQMFVRGLQGSYNAYTTKRGLSVPNGDVLVFALACGQIMYGFLLRPDTLPRSYTSWIGQAAKVPAECVRMNHDMFRDGAFDINDLEKLTNRADITSTNKTALFQLRDQLLNSSSQLSSTVSVASDYFPRYAPCSAIHPSISRCSNVPLDRFFAVSKWMLPIYGALHIIPAILFKRKAFAQDPGKVLLKASLGSLRSSAFLGVFVVIFQSAFCYKHRLHKFLTLLKSNPFATSSPLLALLSKLPQPIIDSLTSKASIWALGFAAGLSLFVEEKRRRGELAMYVLPKGLESAWVMARGKGLVFRTGKWGETILTSLGMALVMTTYQNDPQHLSGLVRRILYQFIGPN